MDFVKCWYCKHYKEFYFCNHPKFVKTDYGFCEDIGICRYAYEQVCRHFCLRQGLHTKKTIPNFNDK